MVFLLCLALMLGIPRARGGSPKGAIAEKITIAEKWADEGYTEKATRALSNLPQELLTPEDALRVSLLQARMLHEKGRRIEAISRLQTVLAALHNTRQPDPAIQVETYFLLGDCYFGLNRFEYFKAMADTALALALTHHLPDHLRARAHTQQARYYAYHTLGYKAKPFLDSALYLYNRASPAEKKLFRPVALCTVMVNYSRNSEHYPHRLMVIDSAMNILMNPSLTTERFAQAHLWRAIGNGYFDGARWPEKEKNRPYYSKTAGSFEKAKQLLQKYYPENNLDQALLNNLLGLVNFYCGYFTRAEQNLLEAENILVRLPDYLNQYTYTLQTTYGYQIYLTDSLYRGETLFNKKTEALEKWKRIAPYWQNWQDANLLEGFDFFRDVYSANPYGIIVHLCYSLYQLDRKPQYLQDAFAAQETSKARYLKKKMMKDHGITELREPDLSTVQASLQANQAILSISDVRTYFKPSFIFLITRDMVTFHSVNVDSMFSKGTAGNFGDSTNFSLSYFKKSQYAAYEYFFKPLEPYLPKEISHLIVFPSSTSSMVNFNMMVSDTAGHTSFATLPYLCLRYQISYDYSWQISELRKRIVAAPNPGKGNPRSLIPDYQGTTFYQLPFFRKQAQLLKSRYGFSNFSEGNATRENYIQHAPNASLLHLAGHLHKNVYQFAKDLHLVMDSVPGQVSYLDAATIMRTPLQADLSVLALCESGLGDIFNAEAYFNVGYWFAYAGSKSCLYSLWKLDDRSTAFILERFYHYLSQGLVKSKALQQAQRDYLAQTRDDEECRPIYWGGLSLIGDDSPIELEERNGWFRVWYLLLLLPVLAVAGRKFLIKKGDQFPKNEIERANKLRERYFHNKPNK